MINNLKVRLDTLSEIATRAKTEQIQTLAVILYEVLKHLEQTGKVEDDTLQD